MVHSAGVDVIWIGGEWSIDETLESPVVAEGQVTDYYAVHLLPVLQKFDVNLRGVEALHVAVQEVRLLASQGVAGVDLHLGGSCGETGVRNSPGHLGGGGDDDDG